MGPLSGSGSESLPSSDETLVEGDGARPRREPTLGRGDQVGRYLLLDPLGRGAMGQVFRAYDPDLDRQVAIKILLETATPSSDAHERLLGEAKAMARIHHPHVITVHDAGMHEGSVFIAMEIVDGPSLDRWLATPRSPAAILDVLTDAARGLAAAHAAGVVHRDFKPANVLVTASDRAKVGDFGLAGIEEPSHAASRDDANDGAGHAVGTPAYMSPEHFAGVGIDARSDQFSFAITLHEALYGVRPFDAESLPELVAQVMRGQVSPELAARRGRIDGMIRRALAVDPALRFASMDELVAALERARRPRWRSWAIAGAVAAGLGLVLVLAAREREPVVACERGAQRVAAVWNGTVEAELRIDDGDATETFSRRARAYFEDALDDYGTAWSSAYDESCAAVGARALAGTPVQQRTARCLENRLDSLRGLTELATREPLPAERVSDLVRAMPSIEECKSGSWFPYPSDPEAAAQVDELHRRLDKLELAHIWGQQELALAEAEATVEAARTLGDQYLLGRALTRHAVVLEEDPRAIPLFDESLEISSKGGFEALSATTIDEILKSEWYRDHTQSWRELAHLAAIARGLIERTSGDAKRLGNLAINEGNVMRRAGRLDDAAECDRRAETHFASIGSREGVAKARINQAVTELRRGRLEQAVPRLEQAVAELEQATELHSELYYQAQYVLVGTLTGAGRTREAYEVATKAYAAASQRYAPHASSFRRMLVAYTTAAGNVGELEAARAALDRRREITTLTGEENEALDMMELELLLATGRFEDVLTHAADLRRAVEDDDAAMHAWLDLYALYALQLLGRRAEVHARLVAPGSEIDDLRQQEGQRTMLILVAMLSDAPAPPGETWRSRFPTQPYQMAITAHVHEVIEALASGRDTVTTLRRVRNELAAMYHPRETTVQLLDAWLAEHDPDAPPAAAPR